MCSVFSHYFFSLSASFALSFLGLPLCQWSFISVNIRSSNSVQIINQSIPRRSFLWIHPTPALGVTSNLHHYGLFLPVLEVHVPEAMQINPSCCPFSQSPPSVGSSLLLPVATVMCFQCWMYFCCVNTPQFCSWISRLLPFYLLWTELP
jgi:hypothetical protein